MTDLKGKNIIVTGASGGIGNSIIKKFNQSGANRFLENKNVKIYGVDNLNDYYDVDLKRNMEIKIHTREFIQKRKRY